MACPALGSTSQVSLYWAEDADPSAAIPDAQAWDQVRITGESLDLALTSTVSDEITPQRSYSNSVLTQGEVSGGFNFDASLGVVQPFLLAALQSSETFAGWLDTETIQNESDAKCLMFLKIVDLGAGTLHYFTYRGCQISSMTLTMEPGSIITGEVTLMGVGGGVQDAPGASWTYNSAANDPLMSAVDALQNFELRDSSNALVAVTFQNLSITFDNQLRQQLAIGTGSLYAAGTGSGRFMCTMSSTQYYSSHDIYDALIGDEEMSLQFDMLDSAQKGFHFNFQRVKVQDGAVPLAGGPDADLLISPNLQAFEDGTTGTVSVTLDTTT